MLTESLSSNFSDVNVIRLSIVLFAAVFILQPFVSFWDFLKRFLLVFFVLLFHSLSYLTLLVHSIFSYRLYSEWLFAISS